MNSKFFKYIAVGGTILSLAILVLTITLNTYARDNSKSVAGRANNEYLCVRNNIEFHG